MPYNNIVSRAEVAALNTEEVSQAMMTSVEDTSAALTLFRRIPVAQGAVRFPILSALPIAYLVDGDTGLKQTSEANWANKSMTVREWAVIVPVPDSVLEDAQFDIFGAVRPLASGAISRAIDAAIFFGVDKPTEWPDDITTAAVAAGNVVARGTATAAQGGIAEDINQLFATVEADGYDVNGLVANRTFRARVRGARSTDGQKLLDVSNESLDGIQVRYVMPGLWPSGLNAAELFAGDYSQGIIGVRRDFTFDLSNEAVIQDNVGTIIYNAYQQDLTLLRVTFRVGFQIANPINRSQPTEGSRYPFAVLRSPAA